MSDKPKVYCYRYIGCIERLKKGAKYRAVVHPIDPRDPKTHESWREFTRFEFTAPNDETAISLLEIFCNEDPRPLNCSMSRIKKCFRGVEEDKFCVVCS